jgi:hypothetical protein
MHYTTNAGDYSYTVEGITSGPVSALRQRCTWLHAGPFGAHRTLNRG